MASISKYLVSQTGLHLWVNADESPITTLGTNITGLTDLSPGSHNMVGVESPYPQLLSLVAAANNMPAMVFNGTSTGQLSNLTSVLVYHVFVVASSAGSTFGVDYRGLLCGTKGVDGELLLGDTAATAKFRNGGGQTYRSANTLYDNTNMVAPMSLTPRVLELQYAGGFPMSNGLQIGKDRTFETRLWNGHVFEVLVYTRVLTLAERLRIYQYFTRKYQLWEQISGYDVFPAVCDWGSPRDRKKKVLFDEAEDSTAYSRVKALSKKFYDLSFTSRMPDEVKAVDAFYDLKHPGNTFIYRDRTFYPEEVVSVRFDVDASIEAVPSNHVGFNYKTKLREV